MSVQINRFILCLYYVMFITCSSSEMHFLIMKYLKKKEKYLEYLKRKNAFNLTIFLSFAKQC